MKNKPQNKPPIDLCARLSDTLYEVQHIENKNIRERNDSYLAVKGVEDLLDQIKLDQMIQTIKTCSPGVAEFLKRSIEEKAKSLSGYTPGDLRFQVAIELSAPVNLHIPCRPDGCELEKDIIDHTYGVASRSLGADAEKEAFGDYIRIKAASGNLSKLETELCDLPGAMKAARIILAPVPIKIGARPPIKDRIELILTSTYIKSGVPYISTQDVVKFPAAGTPFTIESDTEDCDVTLYTHVKRPNNSFIRGFTKWKGWDGAQPGDKLSLDVLEPLKRYRLEGA